MQRNKLILLLAICCWIPSCKPLAVISTPEEVIPSPEDPEYEKKVEDILKSSLLSYYTFDDETAKSKSEFQYDGVLFGSPSFITDTPSGQGKALFLNGLKEQWVNIPYNLFKGLPYFTISLWLKDFSTGNIISGISTGTYPGYYSFPRLFFTSDGKMAFDCRNRHWTSAPTFSYPCTSLQSGQWHHIAVTCSRGFTRLYVDGIPVDSFEEYWEDVQDNTPKVQIGGNGDGIFAVTFSGKVDNVAIYTTALSDSYISLIYKEKL